MLLLQVFVLSLILPSLAYILRKVAEAGRKTCKERIPWRWRVVVDLGKKWCSSLTIWLEVVSEGKIWLNKRYWPQWLTILKNLFLLFAVPVSYNLISNRYFPLIVFSILTLRMTWMWPNFFIPLIWIIIRNLFLFFHFLLFFLLLWDYATLGGEVFFGKDPFY